MPKGALIAILGESGSGKSTLLRVIDGEEKPNKGQVLMTVGDVQVAITDLPTNERDIHLMPPNYELFINLDTRKNIAYGLKHKDLNVGEVNAQVPALLNEFTSLLKESAIIGVLDIKDLLSVGEELGKSIGKPAEILLIVGALYFAIYSGEKYASRCGLIEAKHLSSLGVKKNKLAIKKRRALHPNGRSTFLCGFYNISIHTIFHFTRYVAYK